MSEQRGLLVIKYGSECLANQSGVDYHRIGGYVRQLAALHEHDDLIVVTSGAVKAGKAICRSKDWDITDNQVLASLGAHHISTTWSAAFNHWNIAAGQVLVTHDEIDDPTEGAMLTQTLTKMQKARVVPLVNQNDAMSDQEMIELEWRADNDDLAGHIARTVRASRLLLLTNDVEGVLDDKQQVIPRIETAEAVALARRVARGPQNDGQSAGKGGMAKKNKVALETRGYMTVHIANAAAALQQVIAGQVGTTFSYTGKRQCGQGSL